MMRRLFTSAVPPTFLLFSGSRLLGLQVAMVATVATAMVGHFTPPPDSLISVQGLACPL